MTNVDWSKYSAISQIVGSIAIVLTLIYLSIQTQQNTAATQANSRDTVIDSDLALSQMAVGAPSIRLLMSASELTDLESAQLYYYLVAVARTREHQWLQYKNGLLDRRTLDSFLTGLTVTISRPRSREWWDYYSYRYFDDDFVDEVNEILSGMEIEEDFVNLSPHGGDGP